MGTDRLSQDRQTGKMKSWSFLFFRFFWVPLWAVSGVKPQTRSHMSCICGPFPQILPRSFSSNCIIFINKSSTLAAFLALVTLGWDGRSFFRWGGVKMGNFAFPGQ